MTLELNIPESLLQEARKLAAQQKVSVDQFIADALSQQISAAHRPTAAQRARRVNWEKVDEILSRVPASPPLPGDELPGPSR